MNQKLVMSFFPEEREITKEDFAEEKIISKTLKKEIFMLCKLGLDEAEIKLLLTLKQNEF